MLLARACGRLPIPFTTAHTKAYSIHSIIVDSILRKATPARQYARGPSFEDSVSMLDSTFRARTNHFHHRETAHYSHSENRLDSSHRSDPLRLLLQPSGRDRLRRAGRAALRLDRTRHDGERRLGDAASLRKTLVRKTTASLLERRAGVQMVWRERGRGALAERPFGVARYARAGLVGAAALRL